MNKLLLTLISVALLNGVSFADSTSANSEKTTEQSTSTNPLTGTKTTTRKYKKSHKNADGSAASDNVTEKTKVYKNGTTSTNTEEKATSETK